MSSARLISPCKAKRVVSHGGYMWGNGHFATRKGHYHPIGGDLNAWLSNAVFQTGVVNSDELCRAR